MRVFGIVGWSGSGKTTLLSHLIPALVGQGIRVSTIKHAHHAFDIDQPGKDSHTHRIAGATEVLIGSGKRWALMHELRDEPEPGLAELLARMSPVDLVLVEGFKRDAFAKLEVHRPSNGKELLQPNDPTIVGVASDAALDLPVPLLALDDIAGIARFVLAHAAPIDAVTMRSTKRHRCINDVD